MANRVPSTLAVSLIIVPDRECRTPTLIGGPAVPPPSGCWVPAECLPPPFPQPSTTPPPPPPPPTPRARRARRRARHGSRAAPPPRVPPAPAPEPFPGAHPPGLDGLVPDKALQVFGQLGRRLVAPGRVARRRLEHNRFQVAWHAGVELARPRRRGVLDLREELVAVGNLRRP